jgi:3-methyl-2-oxobutanoate hydroxymethyltransferase
MKSYRKIPCKKPTYRVLVSLQVSNRIPADNFFRNFAKTYVFLTENQALNSKNSNFFCSFSKTAEFGPKNRFRLRLLIQFCSHILTEKLLLICLFSSCYDYTTAKLLSQTDVQMILVGDSAAQVVLGFDSTLPATMDFMVTITAAVRRGAPNVYLVADMPFLSYQVGVNEAVRNAGRFVTEAGAQMIKIEASEAYLDVIKAVSDAGMAVMAHIGIRPQSIGRAGKLKAEATEQMIQAGAGSLLIEGAATEVAEIITRRSEVPVIGCGSGAGCDGQILIAHDILGLTQGPSPKFAKSYGNLADATIKAFSDYTEQVQNGDYPDSEHSYHMKAGELDRLQGLLRHDV